MKPQTETENEAALLNVVVIDDTYDQSPAGKNARLPRKEPTLGYDHETLYKRAITIAPQLEDLNLLLLERVNYTLNQINLC